jgi:serine/threonine protein kinase
VVQIFESDNVAIALGVSNVEYLGTGSYGETYRAALKGRDCAVKIIHKAGYSPERLEREIAGYTRVAHANVVELFETYTVTVDGGDRAALEFEFVDGGDLREANGQRRASGEQLRGLARGLLSGIAAIHAADLLHRDLKPANIALRAGKYETPVILDLGLAKLLDVESITTYPARIGSVMYMAPEQLRSERALKASDLWAIGVILLECSTGQHPFFNEGETLTLDEALARVSQVPTVPDGIPHDVADLIQRCLAETPYRRGTVAKALERLD